MLKPNHNYLDIYSSIYLTYIINKHRCQKCLTGKIIVDSLGDIICINCGLVYFINENETKAQSFYGNSNLITQGKVAKYRNSHISME